MQLVSPTDPILSRPAPEYIGDPDALREPARQMYNLMVLPRNGVVGLAMAANQVGLEHRMFVMLTTSRPIGFGSARVCINPRIESGSDPRRVREQCLSFPGEVVQTTRFDRIIGSWTDLKGRRHKAEMFGLSAQCFAHELDHLNGITMHARAAQSALAA